MICTMHIDRPVGVVHARTDLGLRPSGVAELGSVLLDLGLADRLNAQVHPAIEALPFNPSLDPVWGVPNVAAVASFASLQADAVSRVWDAGQFPVVLGGDDSILFGGLLAIRRQGPVGLLLLDAHTDFWDTRDGDGELSDSDLWIATGNGPPELADVESLGPLVLAEHTVVYGHRDRADQIANNSADVYKTRMLVRSLAELRAIELADAANHASAFLEHLGSNRIWIHLDSDCLDDSLMPSVDWRVQGGLHPDEVEVILSPLLESPMAAGMSVSIYNPSLDSPDHAAARVLLDLLVALLT